MKEGHIFTEGEIGNDYPDLIAEQIARQPEAEKFIHHISSPGGSVQGGYNGYHKLIKTGKVIDTIVEGEAQSMASFLMLASDVTGGKIKILNPSRVMIHMPKLPVNGFADSEGLQSSADNLKVIEKEMAEVYMAACAKRGKAKNIDEVKAMMRKETNMSAQDAVNMGFADEVINYIPKEENSKLKAVALGLKSVKAMEKGKGIGAAVADLLTKAASLLTSQEAKAVELPLKEGGVINVDGEEPAEGAGVTIEGKPAEGTYTLADGRSLECMAGKITKVMPAPSMPPVPPTDADKAAKLALENEQLRQQLAAQVAAQEKAKQEEQQKLVQAEKEKIEAKLAEANKQLEEIKKHTVGDATRQSEGVHNNAVALGGQFKDKEQRMATLSYLADNLPWIEHTEPFQKKYPHGRFSDGTYFRDYRSGGPCAVSILETNLNYTWNGILSMDLFFKPTLGSPALGDIFTVDLGATDTKRYHIAPTANKILKPYTGCAQAVTGTALDITSKKIQLKPFEMYEGWCKDDFTNQLSGSYNVLAQEWLKTGTDSFDPAGTPIDRMIVQLLKDGLRRDIFRRVSFGDTTSANADWNQIDGYWQSLIDQSGASNYCVYASKTNFGIGALSADAAYNELIAIFNGSSNLLKQEAIDGGKGKFLVTRSIWENLYTTYTGVGAVTELAYTAATKGLGNLTFRGIPVIPVTIWDDFLADSANPLFATTRHLISFTLKENHILGVENTADLNKIDSWFEKKDNQRYYRSNMVMGFLGPIHCDLTTISY